jgi:signal peptidase II
MNKAIKKISTKNIAIALVIAIFFMADRFFKLIAQNLGEGERFLLLGDFFSFEFVQNRFIAFSLPLSGPFLNLAISLIIIALVFVFYRTLSQKKKNELLLIGIGLVIIGALSNLLDRLILGYVVDYFYLQNFSVLNLADAYISIGSILAIIALNKKPAA